MRYRPLGTDPIDPRLGRFVPDDWEHVDKYPLLAGGDFDRAVPLVGGVNWYPAFDRPFKDSRGHWYVAVDGRLGMIRGGHAICFPPAGGEEPYGWWDFYDQGSEGACVGFAWSRAMSILNRKRYAARWLWDRAKERDEWSETNPGDSNGTSVRAAGEVLISSGHVPWKRSYVGDHLTRAKLTPYASPSQGIGAFRWATSVDDALAAVGAGGSDYIVFENSWGRGYPRRVRMPATILERLLHEDGELAVPTDR